MSLYVGSAGRHNPYILHAFQSIPLDGSARFNPFEEEEINPRFREWEEIDPRPYLPLDELRAVSARIAKCTKQILNSRKSNTHQREALFVECFHQYQQITNYFLYNNINCAAEKAWFGFNETLLRTISVCAGGHVIFEEYQMKIGEILGNIFQFADHSPLYVIKPNFIKSLSHMEAADNQQFFSVMRWYAKHLNDRERKIIRREIVEVHSDHIQDNRTEAAKIFEEKFKDKPLSSEDRADFETILTNLRKSIKPKWRDRKMEQASESAEVA